MSYRFFYLYVFAGTVAFSVLAYQVSAHYPEVNISAIAINALPGVVLYYLAYKVFRAKHNKELM